MRSLMLMVLLLCGCGRELPTPGAPATVPGVVMPLEGQRVVLTLETRAGAGSQGWSLGEGHLVPAAEADVVVQAFDCGARGRWVSLASREIEFCAQGTVGEDGWGSTDGCNWLSVVEVGGTRPAAALNDWFLLRRVGDQVVARAVLVDRTETPTDWYLEVPVRPFVVTLDLLPPTP